MKLTRYMRVNQITERIKGDKELKIGEQDDVTWSYKIEVPSDAIIEVGTLMNVTFETVEVPE